MSLDNLTRRWLIVAAVMIAAAGCAGAGVLDDGGRAGPVRAAGARRFLRAGGLPHPVRPRPGRLIIGWSVQGRELDAMHVEGRAAGLTMLVVGCIHGSESAGIPIARRLATAPPLPGTSLWIIPDLNPDGVAGGTRQNAHGVDLNRNFPWRWRPLGARGNLQYSGPHALSEPEARAATRLIERIRPQVTIWFHQPEALVDLSGGNPAIERTFAKLVGLPVLRLARYPGSAISWENALLAHSTAFDVELPPGSLSQAAVTRYAHAITVLAGVLRATAPGA